MKLLMESWRRFLKEADTAHPKVIFMAGAPGTGKGYVRDQLGLTVGTIPKDFTHDIEDENGRVIETRLNLVDPDEVYVPMLKSAGLGADVAKIKTDYIETQQELKNLFKEFFGLEEPIERKERWKHEDLTKIWEDHTDNEGNLTVDLSTENAEHLMSAKKIYDDKRHRCSIQGECFAAGQAQAKETQADFFEQRKSMIIDGTAGYYPRIINQKNDFENAGYTTAMIFVDTSLDTAIASQQTRERRIDPYTIEKSMANLIGGSYVDLSTGEKSERPNKMKPFVNRFGKEQPGYESEFAPNYFRVNNDRTQSAESIAEVKPRLDAFLNNKMEEDFQQDVKRQYKKMKIRLIGKGGNKIKAAPFNKNPSMKRTKSSPPGFGGT